MSIFLLLATTVTPMSAWSQQPPTTCRDPRIPIILNAHTSHIYYKWDVELLRIDSDDSGTRLTVELPLRPKRGDLKLFSPAIVLARTESGDRWRVVDDTKTVAVPLQVFNKSAHAGGFTEPITLVAPSDENVLYSYVTDLEHYLWSGDGGWTWRFPKYRIEGKAWKDFLTAKGLVASAYKILARILAIHPKEPRTLFARLAFRPWASEMGFIEEKTQREIHEKEFPHLKLPGVYISKDGGDNWELFTEKIPRQGELGISPSNPLTMFASTKEGLIRSRDGGTRWEDVGFQRGISSSFRIRSSVNEKGWEEHSVTSVSYSQISFDPKDERRVYVVTEKGIYRSSDQGDSWCLVNMGPNTDWHHGISSLLVNPSNPSELFVGTFQGVFRSGDYGDTWEHIYPLKPTVTEE